MRNHGFSVVLLFVFILFYSLQSYAEIVASETGIVLLADKTRVEFKLAKSVSSTIIKRGDQVDFLVTTTVKGPTGNILVAEGNPVIGKVLRVQRSGMFSRPGKIEIGDLKVKAFDENWYPLQERVVMLGGGDQLLASVVAAGISWPVALCPGSEAEYSAGSAFCARVKGNFWCRILERVPSFCDTRVSITATAWEKTVQLAEAGDPESAYKVAVWAYYGIGMQANPVLGMRYLRIALENGLSASFQEPAMNLLKKLGEAAVLF